jgi:methionyl-tRNA formyltransferase
MGTPQFSCPTMQKILDDKQFEIVGVLTRQPQIAGRGQQLKNSPIHDLAIKNNLKVFTPQSLKSQDIFEQLKNLQPDVAVIVAYGLILPIEILSLPKFGCINLHPSLLPRWRGASPIQRTIFAGDKTTSVDVIQMNQGLDTGDILYRKQINLNGDETYSNLANQLSEIGANAVLDTLKIFKNGDISKFNIIKQDDQKAIYATKISKQECQINWQNDALSIYRQIKALSGSLGSYFLYNDEKIKILDAKLVNIDSQQFTAGTIINQEFLIQCNKGIVKPLILQRQGKKPLAINEFLRGFLYDNNNLI